MNINLKQHLSVIAMLLCVAGLNGCSSTAKPVEQANVKPSDRSNTVVTTNPGNNNTETTTVQNTTVETKDGIKNTTYESNTNLTASSGDKIGVPECDDYIEKYEACVTGKVPESARALMKSSFDQTRKAWKDLAANPNTKSSLASVCKQSKEMAQKSMDAYKCDW